MVLLADGSFRSSWWCDPYYHKRSRTLALVLYNPSKCDPPLGNSNICSLASGIEPVVDCSNCAAVDYSLVVAGVCILFAVSVYSPMYVEVYPQVVAACSVWHTRGHPLLLSRSPQNRPQLPDDEPLVSNFDPFYTAFGR